MVEDSKNIEEATPGTIDSRKAMPEYGSRGIG
jgi:hypothetical protein